MSKYRIPATTWYFSTNFSTFIQYWFSYILTQFSTGKVVKLHISKHDYSLIFHIIKNVCIENLPLCKNILSTKRKNNTPNSVFTAKKRQHKPSVALNTYQLMAASFSLSIKRRHHLLLVHRPTVLFRL